MQQSSNKLDQLLFENGKPVMFPVKAEKLTASEKKSFSRIQSLKKYIHTKRGSYNWNLPEHKWTMTQKAVWEKMLHEATRKA